MVHVRAASAFTGRASVSRRKRREKHCTTHNTQHVHNRVRHGGDAGGGSREARVEPRLGFRIVYQCARRLATRTPWRGNRLQLSQHAWPNVGVCNDGCYRQIGFSLLSPSFSLSLSFSLFLLLVPRCIWYFSVSRTSDEAGLTVH